MEKVKKMEMEPQPQLQEYEDVEDIQHVEQEQEQEQETPKINDSDLKDWTYINNIINSEANNLALIQIERRELMDRLKSIENSIDESTSKLKEAYKARREFIVKFNYKFDIVEGLVVGFNESGEPLVNKQKMEELQHQQQSE